MQKDGMKSTSVGDVTLLTQSCHESRDVIWLCSWKLEVHTTRGSSTSEPLPSALYTFPPPLQFQIAISMDLVVTTSSTTVPTDPSAAQYNDVLGRAVYDFETLMGQDRKLTVNFESAKAVLEVLDKTAQRLRDYRAGNQRLSMWLESYVDLLFMVSAKLWEITQAPPSPEKTICNAIVVLIETACKVEESHKTLADFFDRLQYYLQRVYYIYDLTEFSNTVGIKLLLLKVMAGALSTMVDYIKAMREKPMRKVLNVLARRRDINRILMPHRMDILTGEEVLLSVSNSAAFIRHDGISRSPTAEKFIRDTSDNLDLIQEVDDRSDVSLYLPLDKLQQWLTPPDPLTAHEAAHPGTGKWFIQGKTFRWWTKEKGASLLICGDPGSGKTILCSSIIEEVNRTRNKSELIAYYFFDPKKPDKRNFRGLLASLVTQLCESSKCHPESMPSLYTKCRNGLDPPCEADLTRLLNRFLAELQAHFSIYIIIDGVNDCIETESTKSPRTKVLKFLEDLVRSPRHSKLNICITSSLKEGIEKSLRPFVAGASSHHVILHDQNGQKEDIETYIADFVRRHMQTLPDKDKDDVFKALSERAGGMFGWIAHRLNALRENVPLQTSDILEEVGTPRDEEFAQALHNIPEEKYQYAVRLFQCLVATVRPLSLKELADISAELSSNADPHEEAVLSACPALIVRDKDHPTIVRFSHESVKEFLTSSRLRTTSIENSSRYHFPLKAADATLARVCINVLLRFDITADKTQLRESSPLALYAAQHWVQHTQQGNAATEHQGAMERLFDPSESRFEAWVWMHDIDKGLSRTMASLAERPSQRSATPLYYAALCGFTELVKHLASLRPEDLHDSLGYYGTPLHAASHMGHYDVVLALLDSDPMMVDKKVNNKTPLHAAYYGGQLNIIKLLLDKGADVGHFNTLFKNPSYPRNDGLPGTSPFLGGDSHVRVSGSSMVHNHENLQRSPRSPNWRDGLHNPPSSLWSSSSCLDTTRPSIIHENPRLLPYPSYSTIQSNGGVCNMSFMTSPSDTSSLIEAVASHLQRHTFSSFRSSFDPLSLPSEHGQR